jgi:hypothetical protein
MFAEMLLHLEATAGRIEMRFPLLHPQDGAGFGRREPARHRRRRDVGPARRQRWK